MVKFVNRTGTEFFGTNSNQAHGGVGEGFNFSGTVGPTDWLQAHVFCVPVSEFGIIWILHIRTDFLHGEL